jgi:hypothetical protein
LSYDPGTGVFLWLVNRTKTARAGTVAGSITSQGYQRIKIDGRSYKSHRLVWFYMTGCWPTEEIDHMDGIQSNNRWANIRQATRAMNRENQHAARTDNASGLIGVSLTRGKWQVRIQVAGKRKCLGTFTNPETAHAVYLESKRNLHQGCTI